MLSRFMIFLSVFIMQPVFACGTCFGDPNSSAVNGMNWAIISLLATTGCVLSGISISIFTIAKKSKNQIKSKDI